MQFSSNSDAAGIVEDIDFLINTDANSYPLIQKTRNVNRWMDYAVSVILQSDNRWQWDDINQTDLPIATTNLVDQQQDYEIAGGTFLRVLRVEVADNVGQYQVLQPIDMRDVEGQSMTEFLKTPGMPEFYDKFGNSIFLYPKPSSGNTTLAAGLKVYFQRGGSYFVSTDTTKVPGFASPFHRILSVGAALDFAIANTYPPQKINLLQKMLADIEVQMVAFYQNRNRDENLSMSLQKEYYGPQIMPQSDKKAGY